MIGYRPLLGIATLNPTYGLLRSPDAIRERSMRRMKNFPDFIRATGWLPVGCAARTTPSVDGAHSWVGWMTLFSSTIAFGGWIKRHPPYGFANPDRAVAL